MEYRHNILNTARENTNPHKTFERDENSFRRLGDSSIGSLPNLQAKTSRLHKVPSKKRILNKRARKVVKRIKSKSILKSRLLKPMDESLPDPNRPI